MQPISIVPKYKLLLTFDIDSQSRDDYYQYVLGEFVPRMQDMGIYMHRAWDVVYGDYPERLIEFVTESEENLQALFRSERWQHLEQRLQSYTTNYNRKLVRFKSGYQM